MPINHPSRNPNGHEIGEDDGEGFHDLHLVRSCLDASVERAVSRGGDGGYVLRGEICEFSHHGIEFLFEFGEVGRCGFGRYFVGSWFVE